MFEPHWSQICKKKRFHPDLLTVEEVPSTAGMSTQVCKNLAFETSYLLPIQDTLTGPVK